MTVQRGNLTRTQRLLLAAKICGAIRKRTRAAAARYPISEERIGPNAGGLKLDGKPPVYRVLRLVWPPKAK